MNPPNSAVRPQVPGAVLFPVSPKPGESLHGYICRAAGFNFLDSPVTLLRQSGLDNFSELQRYIIPRLGKLGACLGQSHDGLASMASPRIARDSPLRRINGLAVPQKAIIFQRRRVSPAALAISDHHRAIWMVSPIAYCAETWDVLIGECPNRDCGQVLGWHTRGGVDFCERCGFDLKLAEAPKVPPEFRDALSFIANLLDPDPMVQDLAAARAPRQLAGPAPWDLIELAIMLGRAAQPATEVSSDQARNQRLALGARILLDYPASIDAFWEGRDPRNASIPEFFLKLRRQAEGEVNRGALQVARSIVELHVGREKSGVQRLKRLRHEHKLLGVGEAARALRVDNSSVAKLVHAGALEPSAHRGKVRRHGWFGADDIEAVTDDLANRTSAYAFCKGHALPIYAAEQFVHHRLIRANDTMSVRALHSGLQLDRRDVLQLSEAVGRILVRHRAGDPSRIPLTQAFTALGNQEKPWAPVIKAALRGKLPGGLGSDDPVGLGMRSLTISDEGLAQLLDPERPWMRVDASIYGGQPREHIKRLDAQTYLNALPNDLTWLINNGELVVAEADGIRFRHADVARLGAKYISPQELGARLGIKPVHVRRLLEELEVTRTSGCPFWLRDEVEPVLEWI
jgi:hypothetical protein